MKLIQNANKLISEYGHNSILAILVCVKSEKFVIKIFEEVKNKNQYVRARIAQYLLVILLYYPESHLQRHFDLIEDCLHKLL
mmetsp:Transcript_69798/g.96871  ORF Transcript_69798/g.96871 Transcript_69798/m.96871 type:complete len:82 (+) Transcript_69798:72-317(+)